MLLAGGIQVKVISERLEDSNIKTTLDIYSPVVPNMQEEVANKIDTLLSKFKLTKATVPKRYQSDKYTDKIVIIKIKRTTFQHFGKWFKPMSDEGFEPTTPCLSSKCSPTELITRNNMTSTLSRKCPPTELTSQISNVKILYPNYLKKSIPLFSSLNSHKKTRMENICSCIITLR
jgi:hypothetical protein